MSKDRQKAVAGVFRLVNADEDCYKLRFRGLDPSLDYKIKFQPGGHIAQASGFDLANRGIDIRLDTALTSSLLLLTAE